MIRALKTSGVLLSSMIFAASALSSAAFAKDPGHEEGAVTEKKFKVSSLMRPALGGLDESYYANVVLVEIGPGENAEPTHTHPGDEILYAVSGDGAVYIDGEKHPLSTGQIVHVRRGQTKALGTLSEESAFKVLAFLILERGMPVLEIVEE